MKIYKYELPTVPGITDLEMHRIQYTMHVQVVNEIPYLWAVVDETKPYTHRIHVLFTGDDQPDLETTLRIGTAVFAHGAYVLHYYREAT